MQVGCQRLWCKLIRGICMASANSCSELRRSTGFSHFGLGLRKVHPYFCACPPEMRVHEWLVPSVMIPTSRPSMPMFAL